MREDVFEESVSSGRALRKGRGMCALEKERERERQRDVRKEEGTEEGIEV